MTPEPKNDIDSSDGQKDRYGDPAILARYIEAEWGDRLTEHLDVADLPTAVDGTYGFEARTASFYESIRRLLAEQHLRPRRILDAGSATGRMLLELSQQYPEAEELLGCEPSGPFHELCKWIFKGHDGDRSLPILNSTLGDCEYVRVGTDFREKIVHSIDTEKIRLENCGAESVPRPAGHFDLICCLNVVDRHPKPPDLLRALARLCSPQGLLCLASPMDWREDQTPDKNQWVENLTELDYEPDWGRVQETSYDYVFRTSTRRVTSFSSQVLLLRRKAGD